MRVLHVTHQYYPAIGGAEQYITDLSEALASRGHRVDVFTRCSRDYHTWRSALPSFEQINGVNVYRFRSIERRAHTWLLLRWGNDHYWQAKSRLFEPLIFYGNGPICPQMFLAILRYAG